MAPPHGVLVVDKPAGPTSHDIVDRVRRALGERRVGHTGTLDPFATGVLLVCVGKATRLARFLAEGDKVYSATIRLGFSTTTDDLEGEALGAPVPVHLDSEAVAAAARSLEGEQDQVPPAYSAKRVEGRRLYALARVGAVGPRLPSRVHVGELQVVGLRGDEVDVVVRCSPGTYVRALARDLGNKLGFGGHLVALRRLVSGGFPVEEAISGDALSGPEAARHLRPLSSLLPDVPAVRLSADGLEAVRHGRDVHPTHIQEGFADGSPPRVRLLGPGGDLVALAVPRIPLPGASAPPCLHPTIVLVE